MSQSHRSEEAIHRVYQATVRGSGAVALGGSTAAGAGGVAVGRDVHGGIHISGQQTDEAQEE